MEYKDSVGYAITDSSISGSATQAVVMDIGMLTLIRDKTHLNKLALTGRLEEVYMVGACDQDETKKLIGYMRRSGIRVHDFRSDRVKGHLRP